MKKKNFSVKMTTFFMACLLTITSVPVHIVSLEVDEDQNIIENDTSTGKYILYSRVW